jgi:type I restriction enzyme S subunit
MTLKDATIGDIASVQTGPFGSQLHNKDYVLVGTPIVTVEHLGERKMTRQNLPCVSDADKERLSKYTLQYGDLVFSRVGSVDRCSWVSEDEDGWMFSGRCLRIRPNDPEEIYHKYLYYFFSMESTKAFVRNIAVGATMPSINTRLLSEVPIRYPNVEEQRSIGDALSALDDRIEANRKINHHLEQMAQAIFKSWFVDFEPFGGVMPEDWEFAPLESFIVFQEGPGIRNWQYVLDDGTKFINIRCIQDGDLRIDTANMISNDEANGKYSHFLLNEWDVVVSTSGTLGRYAIVRKEHLPLCLNTSVIRFMPRHSFMHFSYMFSYLTSVEFYDHLQTKASGSVQANFGPMHLRQIEMLVPPDDILTAYHTAVFPLIDKIVENRRESQQLAALLNTLLPRLMSGEVSVADLDTK